MACGGWTSILAMVIESALSPQLQFGEGCYWGAELRSGNMSCAQ